MMSFEYVLKDKVMWSYDSEILLFNDFQKTIRHISGVPSLHNHEGEIYLTNSSIIVQGDENLKILFSSIIQLYHEFDDIYRNSYVKNFGIFWQPLRVEFYTPSGTLNRIYLIINGQLFNKNGKWYNTLVSMISLNSP